MNETSGTALRKEIRKSARFSLKRHYWLFVAAALLAAILGTEYGNATQTLRLKKKEPASAEAIMTDAAAADAVNAERLQAISADAKTPAKIFLIFMV